ncbi:MAG: DUF177 domain-containing protein [Anaerolineaceae bacterium]|nr:DUF177 domain-containing protein [Anaerolineaceae bacterium]
MKSSPKLFQINIGFLINQPIGYLRSIPFEFSEIKMGEEFTFQNLNGSIELNRTQDGLRAHAVFDAEIESECSRCLEKFQEKIHSEFEELFTFPYVESSEDEIAIPEDGNIDFGPIVHDYLLMELPINPICKPDCKGLCAICGQNLNQMACEHHQGQKDKLESNVLGKKPINKEKPDKESLTT